MSQPFIGEIRMFGGQFAIDGWAFCDGSLLTISDFQDLFNLIGTTYGGDGKVSFALPDLRGRAPVHVSAGIELGRKDGLENIALTTGELPVHTHFYGVSHEEASSTDPTGNTLAATEPGSELYTRVQGPASAMCPMHCHLPVGATS